MLTAQKKIALYLCSLTLAVSVYPLYATTYTGSLSYGNGLSATENWKDSSTMLSWTVTNEEPDPTLPDTFVWKYTYTLSVAQTSPSHIIIEASSGDSEGIGKFTDDNFENVSGFTMKDEIKTHHSTGNKGGNPFMPADLYGIKLEDWEDDQFPLVITFYSDRVPVWGDFYSKGGKDSVVYNSGFTAVDPTAPAADESYEGHLLVPDTVPEPGLLTLLGMGGLGLAWKKRR
jgi:hypothetical protein